MNTTQSSPGDQAEQGTRIVRVGLGLAVLLIAVYAGLFIRVAVLKIHPDPRLNGAAGAPFATRPELARRGDLVDREGRIIATSRIGYRLFVDPKEVQDLTTIAVDLAHLIGGDPAAYGRTILDRADSRYVVISHLLNDEQVEVVRQAGLRGVGLEPRLVREYSNEGVGSLVVGMVGFEHTGLAGMEHRFNRRMIPEDGRLTYLKDARGQPLWIEPAGIRPRNDGESVRLSIDLTIQDIAERRLRQAVEQYNAGGGRMVVLDPATGEILAMCDILRKRPGWKEVTTDPAREIHPSLGRNRCATDPYEPGSTFKPFIWAVATEHGRARLDEVLPTPSGAPYVTSRGRRIRDAHYYGPSTWEKVLVKSMNSGMAIVGERMTEKEMQEAVRSFGFGRKTGAGLPGESIGIVTTPRNWGHYTQTSVAYGHEISVTPLQMVQAFAAFACDGMIPELRLTAVNDDELRAPLLRAPIKPETARLTRRIMGKVMTDGTGRESQSTRYTLFGKSGTAQLPRKKEDGGGYYEDRYVSSFIAGAPLEQPRLVVLCVIDDPDRSRGHYGGVVAGPAVRDVMDEALAYLGVPPDKPQDGRPDRLAARP